MMSPKEGHICTKIIAKLNFLLQGCTQEPHSFHNCWYYSLMFFFLLAHFIIYILA